MYLDGVMVSSAKETTNDLRSSVSVAIGRACCSIQRFNGTIDEVRISNRALLPSEFLPFEHNATLTVLSGAATVGSDAIMTFYNMTEASNITVNGTLYRYKDFPIFAINTSGVGVASASVNVTENFSGDFLNFTTNAAGWVYPYVIFSSVNNSLATTYKHNLTAGKSGVGWNSVWMNSSRGNYTITLGAGTGYGIIGNVTASGFTPNVTVGGSTATGPYSDMQPVEIRNGSQIVASFQHNFSAEDLDLNEITVRLGQYWVGFSGKLPATLYAPLRGTYCNVRVCTGITNQSETCAAGWSEWSSEAQGWFCLATINGTVAEEQADPAITKLVAAPLLWQAVAALFGVAFIIFFMLGTEGNKKRQKKR
jgi:hypothetical protein